MWHGFLTCARGVRETREESHMKQMLKLCAVMLVAWIMFTGCKREDSSTGAGGAATTQGAGGAKKQIKIGIVAKSISNAVFQAAHSGAQDAAKELGPKYGV